MIRKLGHRLCDRCGDTITRYCPSLQTLYATGVHHSDQQALVDEIVKLEGVDPAIVWEYVRHRMSLECEQKVVHCTFCGGQLRTWKAKQCMHCFKSWH